MEALQPQACQMEITQKTPFRAHGCPWLQTWGGSATSFVHQKCTFDNVMKIHLTARIKLYTSHEQFQALRQTQFAYRAGLNYVSQYAFTHGKMRNKVGLQEGTYAALRSQYRIPAQMACSIPRQVGATYKALWTKVKKNTSDHRTGRTQKRYKGLDQAPRYVSPTLEYQYRQRLIVESQHVSVLALEGRMVVPYTAMTNT